MRRAGNRQFEEEASREAIRVFDKKLRYVPLRKQEEADKETVVLLCAKGKMLRFLGECEEAIKSFRRGLRSVKPARSPLLAGRLMVEIGLTQYQMGDIEDAKGTLTDARRLARREKNNLPLLPAVLNTQGMCAWKAGAYSRARKYYCEALDVCQGEECELIKADTANNLGLLDWRAGRLEDALVRFKIALKSYSKIAGKYESAATLCNIGIIEEAMGREAYARRHYDKALEAGRKINHLEVQMASLINLGSLALSRQEWDRASDLNQESLEIARSIGDHRNQAIVLENLALCHVGQEDTRKARSRLREARRAARMAGGAEQEFCLDLVEIEIRLLEGSTRGVLDQLASHRQTAKAKGYDAEAPRILRLTAQCQIKMGDATQTRRALTRAVKECRRQKNRPEEKRVMALGKSVGWKP